MPGIPPVVIRGLLEGAGPLLSKISSLFRRGAVKAIEDRRTQQVISAVISAGEHRVDVPVHQPFGFNSHAPLDGAVTHVLQNSADPADLVALMPSNPASMRMGGLREGESILYDAAGQKLHFQNGRVVAVDATEGMVINQKGQPLLTLSEQGHVFYGDLYVKGHIYADEDVTGGGVSLGEHAHDGVQKGEEDTGKPGGGNKPPEPPEPPEPEPKPPWDDDNGDFVGEQGVNRKSRLMPPSKDPKGAAYRMAQAIKDYMKSRGIGIKRQLIKNFEGGKKVDITTYDDKTTIVIRDGEKSSSGRTPDDWYSMDINENTDIMKRLGKSKGIKLKFRSLEQ